MGGGEGLVLTSWVFNGNQVALLTTVPSAIINDDRFAVNTSEVATLIIKNVSDITDGTIQCVVQTSVNGWIYNIQVEITGEKLCLSSVLTYLRMEWASFKQIVLFY